MTITEFLEARIAEDEVAAGPAYSWDSPDSRISEWEGNYSSGLNIPASRLRAECAAKRAIIAAHPITNEVLEVSTRMKFGYACEACFSFGDVVEDHGYCDTLRALAAVYADHPDYDQEWAL